MGYGQQMLQDNQFFAGLKKRLADKRITAKTRLLSVPENYEKIAALPASSARLPMSAGQPDFVFADPMDGVIAVKNGEDILYASLYWRSRGSINHLARVHYLTPTLERDATVNIQTEFTDSGHVFTVPDWTNMGFSRGREEKWYRDQGMHLAAAGDQQPIAVVPADDDSYEIGQENLFAGKGDFYEMTFGDYLIAMNCTEHKSYLLKIPPSFKGAKDLVTGRPVGTASRTVKPKQTLVLYRNTSERAERKETPSRVD
jgi:hypothetical protein